MMNLEDCARTARGCWLKRPTCDGWWWCRTTADGATALTRLTRVTGDRYQPFGCTRDYDLIREAPPAARWQHAGLAESSPPAKVRGGDLMDPDVLEPETPRALYVTYSYTRTGDHAAYREHHSELMGGVEDVIRLADAMHCPEGSTRLGGAPDVETSEGSRNDPEFKVISVRSVAPFPLWPTARSLVADACGRKQSYFDLLLQGRAHRRAVERARGTLREAQDGLRQAEAFLAEHEAHLNPSGLAVARLAVDTAREAVGLREAQIASMVAPVKPIGRPYAGIWAGEEEIGPAPTGAPEEGDD